MKFWTHTSLDSFGLWLLPNSSATREEVGKRQSQKPPSSIHAQDIGAILTRMPNFKRLTILKGQGKAEIKSMKIILNHYSHSREFHVRRGV